MNSLRSRIQQSLACTIAGIVLAAASSAQDAYGPERQDTLLPGSSPFPVPEATDMRFTVDEWPGGLDTGCTFESGGPLVFEIEIDRYFGDKDVILANDLVSEHWVLDMPAYDVDFTGGGGSVSPERDEVYFNDHLVTEKYLTGANNVWKMNQFLIKREWIEFPEDPGPGGVLQPAANEIRIEIDVENPDQDIWCTAIDWAALTVERAPRPIVLVHGILRLDDPWSRAAFPWVTKLDELGIPHSGGAPDDLDMGLLRSIEHNADMIDDRIAQSKDRWGVKKVNIVSHSKGGIDSRHYVEWADDVDRLIQLGTPNAGSPLADFAQVVQVRLCFKFPPLCVVFAGVHLLAGPAGVQLTTGFMEKYNKIHGHNGAVAYTSLAGIYKPDTIWSGWWLLLAITGRGDTIVPESSVFALPYVSQITFDPEDGNSESLHTSLTNSESVYGLVENQITASGSGVPSPMWGAAPRPDPLAVLTSSTEVGMLTQGQEETFSFVLDEDTPSTFMLLFPSGTLSLTLVAPSGATHDQGSAATDPLVVFDEIISFGTPIQTFTFLQPETGTWNAIVHADVVTEPSGEVAFGLTAMIEDPIVSLEAHFASDYARVGDPLVLFATPLDGETPILGASVSALVYHPDLGATQIFFADDGIAPDIAAGDGTYTGSYADTLLSGYYNAVIQAGGNSMRGAFERETSALTTVAASNTSISTPIIDFGEDTNANGLFDWLVIQVPLDVTMDGRYRLIGTLTDSIGNTHSAGVEQDLAVGTPALELRFDGEAIFANGVDGPYTLSRLMLSEDDGFNALPVEELIDAHITAGYVYELFEHPPLIFTGGGVDAGVDLDGNGLYDLLHIEVEYLNEEAGDYQWSAILTDPNGVEVSFSAGNTYLPTGTHLLPMDYDGTSIGEAGLDGPYSVRGLLIIGPSQNLVISEPIYESAMYFASQFEGFVAPAEPLHLDTEVLFSVLDGSEADGDGVVNGLLLVSELVITSNGGIIIDVPNAIIRVLGDVRLSEMGHIKNESPSLWGTGPGICLSASGSVTLEDYSRIRSIGSLRGGQIEICAQGDVLFDGFAEMTAHGTANDGGLEGGTVRVTTSGVFRLDGLFSHLNVSANTAGIIEITSCSPEPHAISVDGRLLATGTGDGGIGGAICLEARQGGLWIPGVGHLTALGGTHDGEIHLTAATTIEPLNPPIVRPDPEISAGQPNSEPCDCGCQ